MRKQIRKLSKGFTIIEVLIVLAIAGLIMLIVFLAVPTLQRNSRNTQRTHDAALIAEAVNECLSNRNGDIPSCDGWTGEVDRFLDYAKIRQLTGGIDFPTGPDPTNIANFATTTDMVRVRNGSICNNAGSAATADATKPRSFTVEFNNESATGGTIVVSRCIDG